MPKKMTDKDRILAFAFRAELAELDDAIAVLKAARAAKAGGTTRRTATTRRASTASKIQPGEDTPAKE